MNIDWTPIILAVIALISAVITTILAPLVKKKIEETKATMDAEKRAKLDYWLDLFIKAAETIFDGAGLGSKKADWVIDQLHKFGIEFDEVAIRLAITGKCRELTAKGEINNGE